MLCQNIPTEVPYRVIAQPLEGTKQMQGVLPVGLKTIFFEDKTSARIS